MLQPVACPDFPWTHYSKTKVAAMRLIMIGPPGGGKGTQARLLSQKFGLTHISTGDVLREAILLKTPAGQQAEPFVKVGKLVPDDLVNKMVAERFRRTDRPERFVMDGYPRTLAQAKAFDKVLTEQKLALSAVVLLTVDDQEIIKRLTGRWNCPKADCKATYHTLFKPPRKAGICDVCGTPLVQRDDDQEATIRKRLEVYRTSTIPLLDHYRKQNLVREVSGSGDIQAIFTNLAKVL
jgi:adenylate kinase